MRGFTLLCCSALLVACAKTETPPADTTAAAPAAIPEAPPAPAPISLKAVAGKYDVTGKNEAGDSTLVTYELNTTDTTAWTLTFPKRKPIAQRIVSVAGDSIVLEAGPYESQIQKGVQVRTQTVYRLQNGKLVGRTVARYDTKGPDTLRIVMSEGIRK